MHDHQERPNGSESVEHVSERVPSSPSDEKEAHTRSSVSERERLATEMRELAAKPWGEFRMGNIGVRQILRDAAAALETSEREAQDAWLKGNEDGFRMGYETAERESETQRREVEALRDALGDILDIFTGHAAHASKLLATEQLALIEKRCRVALSPEHFKRERRD